MPGLLKRVATTVRDMVVVTLLVFLLTVVLSRATGGSPGRAILGNRASQGQVDALNAELGADRPVLEQIFTTIGGYFRGDLGMSFVTPTKSVASLVLDALPVTLMIVALTVLISLIGGVVLGLVGSSRNRGANRFVSGLSVTILAVPPFALALLLILTIALGLGLAPAGGWVSGLPGALRYAWLPSLALSGVLLPQIARIVQQKASELDREDFIEAAEARGLSPKRILVRHILPNSLLPVITIIGFNASALISGAVVVEAVFGIPGFGQVLGDAVAQRDYPVVQGLALAAALIVVLINFTSDVLYLVADPRTRVTA